MYGCDSDSLFAIKCMMKTEPMRLVIGMMVFNIIIFGNAARICEAPLDRVESPLFPSPLLQHKFLNAIWESILTMTTVGFGDIYPRTFLGRGFIFLSAINGITIVSLMVLTVMNTFELAPLEKRAYIVTSKVSHRKSMQEAAVKIIQSLSRIYLSKSKGRKLDLGRIFDLKKQSLELKAIVK